MIEPRTAAIAPRTKLRRFAPVGLVVVGTAMLVAVAAWLLFPSLSIPTSRLIGWQLQGFGGAGFDPTTAQTTTVIPIYVAQWPAEGPAQDGSWLATPAVTYTPWAVIITMQSSASYDCGPAKICGWYDTGGWVEVHLTEPLGGRALFDGSKFPPESRPYR